MNYKWNYQPPTEQKSQKADELSQETGINPILCRLLIDRGVTTAEEAKRFFRPSLTDLHDPFLMDGMDKAVERINQALGRKERILVYGDYDVDGITSTAIFVKYLRALGADVIWHLPTREGEGYGLNVTAVQEIADAGAKILVTVDCGISGNEEVDFAKQLGMRVVVTDHHSPDLVIPNADAVVNPKRADDTSGLEYLAGVGVAFLTVVAVNRELKSRALSVDVSRKIESLNLMNFMDLV